METAPLVSAVLMRESVRVGQGLTQCWGRGLLRPSISVPLETSEERSADSEDADIPRNMHTIQTLQHKEKPASTILNV